MSKLTLVVLLAVSALTSGCILVATTKNETPLQVAVNTRNAGIPSNAILVLYGRGCDIAAMPKPELAPGLLYLYDDDHNQLVIVMPQSKAGPVDITRFVAADATTSKTHYRLYYAPAPVAAPTTVPTLDNHAV